MSPLSVAAAAFVGPSASDTPSVVARNASSSSAGSEVSTLRDGMVEVLPTAASPSLTCATRRSSHRRYRVPPTPTPMPLLPLEPRRHRRPQRARAAQSGSLRYALQPRTAQPRPSPQPALRPSPPDADRGLQTHSPKGIRLRQRHRRALSRVRSRRRGGARD